MCVNILLLLLICAGRMKNVIIAHLVLIELEKTVVLSGSLANYDGGRVPTEYQPTGHNSEVALASI